MRVVDKYEYWRGLQIQHIRDVVDKAGDYPRDSGPRMHERFFTSISPTVV
jgi:hypothetical protein